MTRWLSNRYTNEIHRETILQLALDPKLHKETLALQRLMDQTMQSAVQSPMESKEKYNKDSCILECFMTIISMLL